MHPTFMRGIALLALVALTPAIARADAVSDQKKALKAMGMGIPKGVKMCQLLTPGEAGKFLGKPVRPGVDAGAADGCAFHAADGSNDGVLVMRGARGDWYPPSKPSSYTKEFRMVNGVGEKAYTVLNLGVGYEAAVLSAKGITQVQMSGKAPADAALALVRMAMNR